MFKKILKKLLPKFIMNEIVAYKAKKNLLALKEKEKVSPEFILRQKFYAQFLKAGDIYFDIGANYGNRINPIENIGLSKIIAVEPQKDCCDYLRKNFKDITVLQNGIGAKAETKTFYKSSDSVLSSFSKEFIDKTKDSRFAGNTWNNTEEIEIITLDTLVEKYGVPNFVKVDVEGFEVEVFKGLTKKLKVISFEYTVPELFDNIPIIINKLHSLGECTFNYSISESMELALNTWKFYSDFNAILNTEEFLNTGFGDIYVKYIDA
jgi:FkbM family methyltransferase